MVSAAKIDRLTAFITEYRLWRHIRRHREIRALEDYDVALELKGLKAKAMAARAHIGKLDAAYEAFNAKAGSHVSDVEGLTAQIGYMSDDLSFHTASLGNSVAASNGDTEAVEPPKPPPAIPPPNPPNPPEQPPAAPPAVILNGAPGMQGGPHDVQLIRS
jgi:hypothetical protein